MAGILPLLLLPVLMYFLLIRPQQKKTREQQAMVAAIAEGDEIMTTSGLYGFVTALDGDVAWLEIAENVEIRINKGAIARRVTPTPTPTEDEPAPSEGDARDDNA
jgi:preprotein translocase subunit YajC